MTQSARYGKSDGAGGATNRKVFLAVVKICETRARMAALASLRTLALLTGSEPKTVDSALARLIDSGRVCVVGSGDDGALEYAPIMGELTTVLSKEESPQGDSR